MDLRTAYSAVEAAAPRFDDYAEVTLNDEQDGLVVYFTDEPTANQRAAVEAAAPGTPVEYRIANLSHAAVTRLGDAVRGLIPELDALGFSIRSFGLATFGGHFQIRYESDLPRPPAILMSVINDIAPDRVDLVRGTVETIARFGPRVQLTDTLLARPGRATGSAAVRARMADARADGSHGHGCPVS